MPISSRRRSARTRPESRVPFTRGLLHEQVAAELRRRIAGGVHAPESRIPSEAELVGEFGVSAITIRRAIRDLQLEGLLVGRQGLGVFVTAKRRIRRSLGGHPTVPLRDEMRRAGVEPSVGATSLSVEPGKEQILQRLQLAPGTLLYRLHTLILADGEPVGTDTTYFRRELGDTFQAELSEQFIHPLLVSHGILIDHIDFAIEGGTVGPTEASLLSLPVGFPLLVVHYTALTPSAAPIFTGYTATRADRFTYEFCQRPELHHPGAMAAAASSSGGASPEPR